MPPWKARRVTKKAEALGYKLRAEEDRACKRWKLGWCASMRHGTAQRQWTA